MYNQQQSHAIGNDICPGCFPFTRSAGAQAAITVARGFFEGKKELQTIKMWSIPSQDLQLISTLKAGIFPIVGVSWRSIGDRFQVARWVFLNVTCVLYGSSKHLNPGGFGGHVRSSHLVFLSWTREILPGPCNRGDLRHGGF